MIIKPRGELTKSLDVISNDQQALDAMIKQTEKKLDDTLSFMHEELGVLDKRINDQRDDVSQRVSALKFRVAQKAQLVSVD